MITINNILCGTNFNTLPNIYKINLHDLHIKLNLFEKVCPFHVMITSGFRTYQHHLEIYAKRGVFPPRVPMGSAHLKCQAVDILEKDGHIKSWINHNLEEMARIGLWFEDFNCTPRWVHIQTIAPASGNRFFVP